jgi:hypothetical protein
MTTSSSLLNDIDVDAGSRAEEFHFNSSAAFANPRFLSQGTNARNFDARLFIVLFDIGGSCAAGGTDALAREKSLAWRMKTPASKKTSWSRNYMVGDGRLPWPGTLRTMPIEVILKTFGNHRRFDA